MAVKNWFKIRLEHEPDAKVGTRHYYYRQYTVRYTYAGIKHVAVISVTWWDNDDGGMYYDENKIETNYDLDPILRSAILSRVYGQLKRDGIKPVR